MVAIPTQEMWGPAGLIVVNVKDQKEWEDKGYSTESPASKPTSTSKPTSPSPSSSPTGRVPGGGMEISGEQCCMNKDDDK